VDVEGSQVRSNQSNQPTSLQPFVRQQRRAVAGQRGFTLIELLVVTSIIALLVGIVTVSMARVRNSAQGFLCKNKLKTVAFEFIQFADDNAHPWRGESDQDGRPGFRIEDFQERLYGIAEFWKMPAGTPQFSLGSPSAVADYRPEDQPLICPSGPQALSRQAFLPCQAEAVKPLENVSVGFNMRLGWAAMEVGGRQILREIRLSKRIANHSSVPLAFDVDGAMAKQRVVLPYYAAPPSNSVDKYSSGVFWNPALRHAGTLNAAFIGGQVLSSARPQNQGGWDWKYQHPVQ